MKRHVIYSSWRSSQLWLLKGSPSPISESMIQAFESSLRSGLNVKLFSSTLYSISGTVSTNLKLLTVVQDSKLRVIIAILSSIILARMNYTPDVGTTGMLKEHVLNHRRSPGTVLSFNGFQLKPLIKFLISVHTTNSILFDMKEGPS